jgi:glucose-6-phosphate 1-dehydrogenase
VTVTPISGLRYTPSSSAHAVHEPEPDEFVIRLDPRTGVRLTLEAQRPESPGHEQIDLDKVFGREGIDIPAPYEVLLHAAMQGDSTRFKRQDGVEEAWRVMQPLVSSPPPVHPYAKGTWGPAEADRLVAGHGRWHEPWMP